MIISHRHRFIFLKTRKTAGTSVEAALSNLCGPEDVITRYKDTEENRLNYHPPQNFLWRDLLTTNEQTWRWRTLGRLLGDYPLIHHSPARLVKALISRKIWDSYFKFTIERNPFDKAVSLFHFKTKDKVHLLYEYLDSCPEKILSNWGIYTVDDRIAVDFVLKFESLEADLAKLRSILGLGELGELPRMKSNYRSDRRNYRDVLSSRERSIIEKKCRKELEYFGFSW